jgi:hypothetical protein
MRKVIEFNLTWFAIVICCSHPLTGQINDPACCPCSDGGVQDTSATFTFPCPDDLDAVIEVTFDPGDSSGADFYHFIDGVVDSFGFYEEPVTFSYCVDLDSCYAMSWWSDDSSNASVVILFDGDPVAMTGPGFYDDEVGDACCEGIELVMYGSPTDCPKLATGAAGVEVIGGREPFTFEWTKQGDPDFYRTHLDTLDGLSAGVYYAYMFDAVGCTATDSIEIGFDPDFNIVNNTADSGFRSFRQAVGCVDSGGVVLFDTTLFGDTIVLTTLPVTIDRAISIIGDFANQITISAESITTAIEIKLPAIPTEIQSLSLTGSTVLLDNQGDTRLQNVRTTTRFGPAIRNRDGGKITTLESSIIEWIEMD